MPAVGDRRVVQLVEAVDHGEQGVCELLDERVDGPLGDGGAGHRMLVEDHAGGVLHRVAVAPDRSRPRGCRPL